MYGDTVRHTARMTRGRNNDDDDAPTTREGIGGLNDAEAAGGRHGQGALAVTCVASQAPKRAEDAVDVDAEVRLEAAQVGFVDLHQEVVVRLQHEDEGVPELLLGQRRHG